MKTVGTDHVPVLKQYEQQKKHLSSFSILRIKSNICGTLFYLTLKYGRQHPARAQRALQLLPDQVMPQMWTG